MYYKLTNYYQNNRLYAKSYSAEQLKGKALALAELATSCDPLAGKDDMPYYPCGLIANSFFSDIFGKLSLGAIEYEISDNGIAWPADKNLYGSSDYKIDQVLPPPTWITDSFPDDLKKAFNIEDGKFVGELPKLQNNERFINGMKVAGFPTFRKLYGRIDVDTLPAGKYKITVQNYYNVKEFGGTKSIVLSTTSWAGGKNSALGWSFIIIGGILLAFGVFFLVMFMMSPRKVGDVSYLSWYNENLGDFEDDE